ncbi:tyrosine-type recombinase/integrase [Scytonema sp. UIC 10036]|uniref:tyrosine-type recombinase/integrase n=1 Tax=Scytonema sp. UIC 10036 TaxID=2304196 RepID=UPI0012DAB258|nr:tyrosine-type recombinase/integrase [Scytonema sp. UIC 10036]MUG92765.1 tyrosine-type recombinase/integrase [Scytonema sp. UIC 10036]
MSSTTSVSLVLTVPLALTEHPAAVYLNTLSPGSQETIRQSLNYVAGLLTDGKADYLTLNWAELRYKHTAAVRAALAKKYSPATTNKILSAVRRVLKEALRLDLISPVDYSKAVDLESVKVRKTLRGRALSQDEINKLMSVCFSDPTPGGYRDAAMVAVLRGAGLRRSEAVKLNVKDFDPETGELKILEGKGRVDRVVYLPETAIAIVQQWLDIRGTSPGALLCKISKSGRVIREKLTPQAIAFLLKRRGNEAGLEPFSAHDLRRTFVSDLLDSGADIVTVQQLAGHSSITQTSRYDRRGDEKKRKAVQSLHIPIR